MRTSFIILTILVSALVAGVIGFGMSKLFNNVDIAFVPEPTPVPTPLAKYTLENLKKVNVPDGRIEIREVIDEEEKFTSFKFSHKFDPTFSGGEEKEVTGQINLPAQISSPSEERKYPLVLMFRGYVDQSIYETGIGTRNAAAFFANNGFITLAPDFLGYGGSSSEAGNIFETRFQTYTTALSLLTSIEQGGLPLRSPTREDVGWDNKNIFIWAHSNGGQIALTLLSITGKEIPTTLWAPVTKPFPYSILYYTDESQDGGKFIRKELAKFETLYDVDDYNFTKKIKDIKANFLVHQGGADDAIPLDWTNQFVRILRNNKIDVEYFVYPNADHNMRPDWNTVVVRDLEFFTKNLKQLTF